MIQGSGMGRSGGLASEVCSGYHLMPGIWLIQISAESVFCLTSLEIQHVTTEHVSQPMMVSVEMGVKVKMGQEWVTSLVENDAYEAGLKFHFLRGHTQSPALRLYRESLIVISCVLVVLRGFISCEFAFPSGLRWSCRYLSLLWKSVPDGKCGK